jgi:Na+-driven multidrug efflux pump
LWFWFPLFLSWLLMAGEGPGLSAVINRLPDEVVMLAAYGIVVSLSVTIESPIINLLATSTALSKDRASYLLIRRFTLHWMIGLTLVHVAVAFTGLFDTIVVGWLNTPPDVAAWVRPGMQVMILWSAAIAWRRFCQGILIRYNRTRTIAWGTIVRLVASVGGAIGLALLSDWPGVVIGATGLMAGVIAEAIYATIVVRPVLAGEFGPQRPPAGGEPLTYRALFWFHLPLASTSLLILLAQPMVAFSLARLPEPTQSLAAWPLVFQAMLVARAAAFALPEAVIALTNGPHTLEPIRRFTVTLTLVITLIMAVFVFTPLVDSYLLGVQDATPALAALAHQGLIFFLPLPGLTTLISWLRGLLINTRATKIVNLGMAFNLAATAVALLVGVQARLPGLVGAAIALNVAYVIELAVLWRGAQGSVRRIADRPVGEASLAEA